MRLGYDAYRERVEELAKTTESGNAINPGHRIDEKILREVDAASARLAVLEYLKTKGRNISDAARTFDINRKGDY